MEEFFPDERAACKRFEGIGLLSDAEWISREFVFCMWLLLESGNGMSAWYERFRDLYVGYRPA